MIKSYKKMNGIKYEKLNELKLSNDGQYLCSTLDHEYRIVNEFCETCNLFFCTSCLNSHIKQYPNHKTMTISMGCCINMLDCTDARLKMFIKRDCKSVFESNKKTVADLQEFIFKQLENFANKILCLNLDEGEVMRKAIADLSNKKRYHELVYKCVCFNKELDEKVKFEEKNEYDKIENFMKILLENKIKNTQLEKIVTLKIIEMAAQKMNTKIWNEIMIKTVEKKLSCASEAVEIGCKIYDWKTKNDIMLKAANILDNLKIKNEEIAKSYLKIGKCLINRKE